MLFGRSQIDDVAAVDFHCHILPCADHGSDSVETSLKQLELLKGAGIETVVATPHFYPEKDNVEEFLARRSKAFGKIAGAQDGINIVLAAEVALSTDLAAMPRLEELCLQNTQYILIEMPFTIWTRWVYEAVYEIRKRGLKPIIVHINRYSQADVLKLLEQDVVAQVNAEAFADRASRGRYAEMFRSETAHLLGSDLHMLGEQCAQYKKAVRLLGETAVKVMDNARAILNNKRYYER